ncbi:hypothetical protein HMPREF0765_0153 [Sphingobacterium spiritivorum ATCC 33300]|uniref:DUF4397 domain-containing protein n=2 Tax=Sphingobacterium spiritivorum TaxID=258 RepID=C2FS47_SPHSI|nr:hypothetical protein HMPREF0765_0153 [Sphingobacterium spiritivorum ATCC 33300]QQS98006.1 DUF4397 domain-containing protein [Sphingobacterium spiritivorum]
MSQKNYGFQNLRIEIFEVMKSIKLIICILGLVSLLGCEKSVKDYGNLEFMTNDDAIVKINMASVYPDDRYMYVKFNDQRVTPLIRAREPYPGGGWNTRGDSRADFLRIKAGNVNVKLGLPKKKDDGTDSLILYETNIMLTAGKRYTLHLADTAANTKSLLTEEDFSVPDSLYARYRFVNLMPNVPAVDLYYGFFSTTAAGQVATQDSLVASNIKFMEMSEYFVLNRSVSRTWKVRPAGAAVTNATVIAFYGNAGTIVNQRTYTAFALGYNGQTSTAMKPYLSFFNIR